MITTENDLTPPLRWEREAAATMVCMGVGIEFVAEMAGLGFLAGCSIFSPIAARVTSLRGAVDLSPF